jgi:hypothetical protein
MATQGLMKSAVSCLSKPTSSPAASSTAELMARPLRLALAFAAAMTRRAAASAMPGRPMAMAMAMADEIQHGGSPS